MPYDSWNGLSSMSDTILLYMNTAGLLVLAVIQYFALRQIGIMLPRLGPLGARSVPEEGPRVGECIESQLNQLQGTSRSSTPGEVLLLFVSSACPVCKEIRQSAALLRKTWNGRSHIVLLYDEDESTLASKTDLGQVGDVEVRYAAEALRASLNVLYVPFGVMVNSANVVLAKGLVNSASHVESLLEAGSA